MAHVYPQALRLVLKGWTILPIPHGWTEPRFDWAGYQTRKPTDTELRAWLAMDTGMGVVCGKVSGNLAALEFDAPGAYLAWQNKRPELARTLPTVRRGAVDIVFFRTQDLPPNGSVYLEGFPGSVGVILGEGKIVPLPPTRSNADPPKWINEVKGEIPTLTFEEAGIVVRAPAAEPREDFFKLRKGKREEVRRERLREWERTQGSEPDNYGSIFKSTPDCFAGREEDIDWVVRDFLPEGYLAILAGDSKSGKSCLATALAVAVATGRPFLDLPTTKSAVLWIAYEESEEERAIAIRPHGVTPESLYVTHERIPIDEDKGLDALRWWIRKTDARLLVIDPLYAATEKAITDGKGARSALSKLKHLCQTEHCAALVLHHLTKEKSMGMVRERVAESHQLLAVASMDILMEVKHPEPNPVRIPNTQHPIPSPPSTPLNPESSILESSNPPNPPSTLNAQHLTPLNPETSILESSNPRILMNAARSAREITLRCHGRGAFANQNWWIESQGVADYRLIARSAGEEIFREDKNEQILAHLRTAALSAEQLADRTGIHLPTLRNKVTFLQRDGLIEVAARVGRTALYRATHPGDEYLL
ncbi:MAG TPA: AAA family ATPase [Fimbriimonadaceae bacterium]|nr:AAA family ATPase [Fimbriimonadaceae bacterium]